MASSSGRTSEQIEAAFARDGEVTFAPSTEAGHRAVIFGLAVAFISVLIGSVLGWDTIQWWARLGLIIVAILGLGAAGMGLRLQSQPGVSYHADREGMTLPHLGKVPWSEIRGTESTGSVYGRVILIDQAWGESALGSVKESIRKHFEDLRTRTTDGSYALPILSSTDDTEDIAAFIDHHATPAAPAADTFDTVYEETTDGNA